MYSETYPQTFPQPRSEIRSGAKDENDAPVPQAPAWLLAGEDEEIDRDHPHICRSID